MGLLLDRFPASELSELQDYLIPPIVVDTAETPYWEKLRAARHKAGVFQPSMDRSLLPRRKSRAKITRSCYRSLTAAGGYLTNSQTRDLPHPHPAGPEIIVQAPAHDAVGSGSSPT